MNITNDDRTARRRKLSILLFVFGAILGMVLIGVSVYADFESTLFDVSTIADRSIRPIQCPIFISSQEEGYVSAVIKNKKTISEELVVRAHISRGHLILIREVQEKVPLGPKETQRLRWEVSPQDAAYGHLILAKIIVFDEAPFTSHKGSCGIIVLKLPDKLSGWHLYWLVFTLSLCGVLSGMRLWWISGRSYAGRRLEATRSILGLGGIVVFGLVCISVGFWEIAAVAFYIGILLIGVMVPHFLIAR